VSNPLDLDAEQVCLRVSILAVLSRFTARRIDDALLAEMAEVLNEEFAPSAPAVESSSPRMVRP
jgi:hypothetical protein